MFPIDQVQFNTLRFAEILSKDFDLFILIKKNYTADCVAPIAQW